MFLQSSVFLKQLLAVTDDLFHALGEDSQTARGRFGHAVERIGLGWRGIFVEFVDFHVSTIERLFRPGQFQARYQGPLAEC